MATLTSNHLALRKTRGFTMVELIATLVIVVIVAATGYGGFRLVQSEQANARAQTSLLSVAMLQRQTAANSGGYLTDVGAVTALRGGTPVVAADEVSTTDDQVSMRVGDNGVWLVAQGDTCQFTYLSPIDEGMTSSTGILTEGQCRADNTTLPNAE